jgi:hypothetical protein
MFTSSLYQRVGTLFLGLLMIFASATLASAGTVGSSPIGKLATSGKVVVGDMPAPTGTVIFSGESVVTKDSPALISFRDGSSVVIPQGAAATFYRTGNTLMIHAVRGGMGFNFVPGEQVNIQAGIYRFTTSGLGRVNAGEIALSSDGQVAMSVSSGSFSGMSLPSGARFEVSPDSEPVPAPQQRLKGELTKGKNTFTDSRQNWTPNSLKGQILGVAGEKHKVVSNTTMTITIEGSWNLASGTYEYSFTGVAGGGFPKWAKVVVPAAAAAGGATGVAVAATRSTKSPG